MRYVKHPQNKRRQGLENETVTRVASAPMGVASMADWRGVSGDVRGCKGLICEASRRRMLVTRIPARMRRISRKVVESFDVMVLCVERVETVYRTVVGVGRTVVNMFRM